MYYKDYPTIKSPELKAIIVEQILVVCVNRTRFNELFDIIRRITSLPRYILKKVLVNPAGLSAFSIPLRIKYPSRAESEQKSLEESNSHRPL